MTSFAPGTPPEVIAAVEKEMAKRQKNAGPNMIPMPPAPDVKSPLRPPPVGKPVKPAVFMTPDQKQAIQAAKGARSDAFAAARGMQDAAARQAAMKAAQDAFRQEKRSVINRPIPQNQLGPRTGGDMLQPPTPTLDTTMSDDFKPRQKSQTGFLDRVKQSGMMKKGGKVKTYKSGGSVSASKRADGCAIKGKTRGRIV